MSETYEQAKRANWPRPTCVSCFVPTVWCREFKATGQCQTCYDEQFITLHRKDLLHEPASK